MQLYAPDSEQFAQLVYDVQELRDSEDPAEATALLTPARVWFVINITCYPPCMRGVSRAASGT